MGRAASTGRESALRDRASTSTGRAGDGRLLIPVVGDDDDGRDRGRRRRRRAALPRPPLPDGARHRRHRTRPTQHYELVNWRAADAELNYRRFFAVNTLAAVRVEDPEVFDETHAEIRRWVDEGLVDGLRVDHPDGLRDPGGYLDDLAALTGGAYVLVEKILEPGETLPADWATDGTTGYDALGAASTGCSSTRPAQAAARRARDPSCAAAAVDWAAMIHGTQARGRRRHPARRGPPDRREVRRLDDPAASSARGRGRRAARLLPGLPLLPARRARAPGRRRSPRPARAGPTSPATFDVAAAGARPTRRPPAALRFQQTSGHGDGQGRRGLRVLPLDPAHLAQRGRRRPGASSRVDADEFHDAMADRQARLAARDDRRCRPTTPSAARTSGPGSPCSPRCPSDWAAALDELLTGWRRCPTRASAHLLWQAVVGAWPIDRASGCTAYAEKAMREAGDRTTWTDPDEAFEDAVHAAVDAAFDDDRRARACSTRCRRAVDAAGRSNSLAAKLVAADRCPACRTSTRAPSSGSSRWSTRTTGGRSTSTQPAAAVLDAATAGDDAGRRSCSSPARRCGCAATGRSCSPAYAPVPRDRAGRRARARLRPRRGGHGRHPAAGRAGGERRLGRHRRSTCRPAAGATCSPAAVDRRAAARPTLLADLPGRAAGAGGLHDAADRFDVWAPRADAASGCRWPATTVEMVRGRRRLVDAGRTGPRRPDARRSTTATCSTTTDTPRPDPRSRRQPDGRPRALAHLRPDRLRLDRRTPGPGRQLAGRGDLRAAHRHVHPGGHARRRASSSSTTCASSASTSSSCCRSTRSTAPTTGATTASLLVRRARGLRRPGRATSGSSTPATPPGSASSRTSSTTTSARRGNYLPRFGPYLKPRARNTWGDLVNLDGDGLRRGAPLHPRQRRGCGCATTTSTGCGSTPCTRSTTPAPCTCSRSWRSRSTRCRRTVGRPLTLIAESDLNDPRLITPREAGGYGLDAQWSDDFHHALHVALTGETDGLLRRLRAARRRWPRCASAASSTTAPTRRFRGRDHGRPVDTATHAELAVRRCASQNHDQIGNRAVGDRLTEHARRRPAGRARRCSRCAGPFTPMLFMGEEWAASTPWQFFTSHPEPELGRGDRRGPDRGVRADGLGPGRRCPTRRTRRPSRARSSTGPSSTTGRHARMLDVYRRLAALRRERPELTDPSFGHVACLVDEDARLFTMWRGDLLVGRQLRRRRGRHRARRARRAALRDRLRRRAWTVRRSRCRRTPARSSLRSAGAPTSSPG